MVCSPNMPVFLSSGMVALLVGLKHDQLEKKWSVWYGNATKSTPLVFSAKIDFFAVLSSVGTRLSKNEGVHNFPPFPYF